MLDTVRSAAMSLLIGACGGGLFALLGLPLPWTLGSLAASAVMAATLNRWPMPSPVRSLALPVVGVMAGSAFTPEVVGLMIGWWPGLLVAAAYAAAATTIGYFVFSRLCGFDRITAYFAAAPGGLADLTLIGASLGASARTLALVHSMRIVTVVFALPFGLRLLLPHQDLQAPPPPGPAEAAAMDWLLLLGAGALGYLIGRFSRIPGGVIVAAMACSAIIHATGVTEAEPPRWLVIFAQVLIGSVAGARFVGLTWAELRTTVAIAVLWASFLLATAISTAALAMPLLDESFETMLLAFAPGGTAEMIIVTYALAGDVAFVATFQLLRILLVLSFTPLFFHLLMKPPAPPASPPGPPDAT